MMQHVPTQLGCLPSLHILRWHVWRLGGAWRTRCCDPHNVRPLLLQQQCWREMGVKAALLLLPNHHLCGVLQLLPPPQSVLAAQKPQLQLRKPSTCRTHLR